jgi:hypothetical protein
MKVSPQARKKNPTLPTHWQVRAVTYEVAGKDKTVFTSLPVVQFSSGGDLVPRALGNRAGIPGYQKLDAAQCHHTEKQESELGLSGAVGGIAWIQSGQA